MKYLAAYVLANLGGEEAPTLATLKKILSAVGADVDEAQAKLVIDALSGKNVNEVRYRMPASPANPRPPIFSQRKYPFN